MSTSLIFSASPATGLPVHLVFGDEPTADIPSIGLTVVGVFDLVAGDIADLTATIEFDYFSGTERPDVGEVRAVYQDAVKTQEPLRGVWQDNLPVAQHWIDHWQEAARLEAVTRSGWQDMERLRSDRTSHYQEAAPLQQSLASGFQDMIRLRSDRTSRYQEALSMQNSRTSSFQDAYRDRRNFTAGRFQDAVGYLNSILDEYQDAVPYGAVLGGRYQDAMPPPAGIWIRPPIPGEDPCYVPSLPVHLVFSEGHVDAAHLVFICERHGGGPGPDPATVVVPIKRVYMVLNEATLRRVSDNALIPTLSMSMALDVDSWTWSFSAALPWQALSLVDGSDPTEVQAVVNGAPYRFIIEKIGTERTFGRNALRVSGRGKSALLDSPYAPSMFFGNTGSRTAQQLMGDVLTLNGVPLDWTVNWEITDWTVPGNVWTHQGSHMSALTNIAAAPGAYIQPHPNLQELFVLPRYPAMPHQWGDLTPDFEIPSAVMTREGIERTELAMYDRVFVSGTTAGVLGQVTRAGTSGELIAPMVTDALITHVDAARQRGLKELSAVGRQQNVTLRMPVLEETGIIPPGKLVRYTDGGEIRLGFTRSVQVEVGLPDIWQSIGVETYA